MRRVRREGASDRVYAWKLEWSLLAMLAVLFLAGAALTAVGLATLSPEAWAFGNIMTGVLSWAVFFWIVLYAGIEYIVWRRTRNLGHRLQFLGAALLAVSPLELYVPLLLGGWSAVFTFAGFLAAILWFVTFFLGIGFALVGYYYRGFRAGDVATYRNLVVREGERIRSLTDGYSERPLRVPYPDLDGVDIKKVAPSWAAFLGRAGLVLGCDVDGQGITVRPITHTGVGTLRLWTALVHVHWLRRHPERLTWVRIGWDRQVEVHLSRYDYDRIGRPVAFHSLAAVVADALVTSLLAYGRGDLKGSVALAAGQYPAPRHIRIPEGGQDKAGIAATLLAALLVLAGLGSAFTAAMMSPARVPLAITDVDYPQSPSPGAPVDVHARLMGASDFFADVEWFFIRVVTFFNASGGGSLDMRRIEGELYGARLGPYPDGTEVRFSLMAKVQQPGDMPGEGTEIAAGPFTMTVGRITRGGPSGLAINWLGGDSDSGGNVTLRVHITSSAAITAAQIAAVGGLGVYCANLTDAGGNLYEAVFPYLVPPEATLQLDIIAAAQDSTWNSTTIGPITMEVHR